MSEHWFPVAVKRAWVPEWLFRLAAHWTPLAGLLCEAPRCPCGELAAAWTPDDGFECARHYRASLERVAG